MVNMALMINGESNREKLAFHANLSKIRNATFFRLVIEIQTC